MSCSLFRYLFKGKGKGSCLESLLHDNACSTDFTFPLARQPATIDPTWDLCTRCPLRLSRPGQCGIQSLPNTSTNGQHRELNQGDFRASKSPWLNPRSSDLESNALSPWMKRAWSYMTLNVLTERRWHETTQNSKLKIYYRKFTFALLVLFCCQGVS